VPKNIAISRGLQIPVAGSPEQQVQDGPVIRSVALLGDDYIGMKPAMEVGEGDPVKKGQVLFQDRKTPGVAYTSPAAGRVAAINRGEKRKFHSVVIEVEGDATEEFASYPDHNLKQLPRESVVENLLRSGLWTALRTRPYGKVPSPESSPKSIFVTAIDTNPLAADPAVVLREYDYDRYFKYGLQTLTTLTEGEVFLCVAADRNIPGKDEGGITTVEFSGPHPAGLPGTHIHFLDPVNEAKTVWHLGYQDVVAIGCLFLTGKLMTDRVISLAGPMVDKPRLVRTLLGASLADLTAGIDTTDSRVISGSVLAGRACVAPNEYLGRYHVQVSILKDKIERELLGWALPGFSKFSATRAFASAFAKPSPTGKAFTTSTEGSVRALVPIGSYQDVMPLDIIATPLLKALLVQDTDTAQALGCLELDEEDLALCTFVCPGKNNYGPLLRQSLRTIEREG